MDNTCRLYTDLAWLWPMWGDAADEYAHYCRHVAGLIEQHAERSAGTLQRGRGQVHRVHRREDGMKAEPRLAEDVAPQRG
jgi:hypothetical protein